MITKILTAVWTAVLVSTSVSAATPIHALPYNQRDDWAHETPEPVIVDPWADAVTLTGYATTYDAYYWLGHQAWFSTDKNGNPGKNAWLHETKASCRKHPEWQCYTVRMHVDRKTWLQYRRPWTSTLKNLYVAVGPLLQSLIPKQLAQYHKIPHYKLRLTSLETGRTVEVWITDTCPCEGYVMVDNKKVHSLVDLSPEAWAEMGRETYYVDGKRYYRNALTGAQWGSNWITVEYLP